MKLGLVLSDLHLGTGHRKGQINIYDDFREDERFEQLLDHFSHGANAEADIHLVLNGDVFDLLKVPVGGRFPDTITERLGVEKLDACVKGHPKVTRALTRFLSQETHRLTYQPGNHDMEFFFPKVQEYFCHALTGENTHPRVQYVSHEPHFTLDGGVQFHHGHQFEAIHAMDFQRLTLPRKNGEPILNLPWGSLFILHVVNELCGERPYLDKVMPFWPLFAGGMIFDTRFTLKMIGASVSAFAQGRLNPVWWRKRPFEKVTRFVEQEVGFSRGLEHFAGRILKNPSLHAVFMGHTHQEMVRTFPGDKVFVNTGSWLPMVNLRLSSLGQSLALHYGLVEWRDDGPPRCSLMRWHGKRPETEEVIS